MALSDRHEKFCQAYHRTGNATESYLTISDCARTTAAVEGWKYIRKPNIKARLAELRGQAAEEADHKRQDAIEWLLSVLATPVGEIGPDHPLAQEVIYTEDGQRVKSPSKMDAMKELSRICGHYEPEKVEHGASDELAAAIAKLSGGRK